MNETTLRAIDEIGKEAGRSVRPAVPIRTQAGPDKHYLNLQAAIDNLPLRFVVAAREAARLSNAVEQWAAVEAAADAFVSARDP